MAATLHGDKSHLKPDFIKALQKSLGIVQPALDAVGISRQTYRNWYRDDPDFRTDVDAAMERQVDFVENKFIQQINDGNVTAMIFYLKTKGRHRGWTERTPQPVGQTVQVIQQQQTLPLPDEHDKQIAGLIEAKRAEIIRLLKEVGKYTVELNLQIELTAKLYVRTGLLEREVFAADHKAVTVELSREGNTREIISKSEEMYIKYSNLLRRNYEALGLNVDALERKTDNDTFTDFIKEIKGEPEE